MPPVTLWSAPRLVSPARSVARCRSPPRSAARPCECRPRPRARTAACQVNGIWVAFDVPLCRAGGNRLGNLRINPWPRRATPTPPALARRLNLTIPPAARRHFNRLRIKHPSRLHHRRRRHPKRQQRRPHSTMFWRYGVALMLRPAPSYPSTFNKALEIADCWYRALSKVGKKRPAYNTENYKGEQQEGSAAIRGGREPARGRATDGPQSWKRRSPA
jgi:hypothetical protein